MYEINNIDFDNSICYFLTRTRRNVTLKSRQLKTTQGNTEWLPVIVIDQSKNYCVQDVRVVFAWVVNVTVLNGWWLFLRNYRLRYDTILFLLLFCFEGEFIILLQIRMNEANALTALFPHMDVKIDSTSIALNRQPARSSPKVTSLM